MYIETFTMDEFHVPGPWNMVSTINWIMAQMHPFQFIALFTFFFTLEISYTLELFFTQRKKASLAYCNQLYFNVKKTKKILLQSLRSQLCPDNESSFQYGFNIQGVSLKLFKKVASLILCRSDSPNWFFFSFCKDW